MANNLGFGKMYWYGGIIRIITNKAAMIVLNQKWCLIWLVG